MKLRLLPLLAMLFISGCLNQTAKNNLTGTWRLYDVTPLQEDTNTSDSAFSAVASLKKIVKAGYLVCFFEDETYTEFKGVNTYKSGSWNFSGKDSLLHFLDSGKISNDVKINVERNSSGKQELTFFIPKKNLVFKFIKEAEQLKNFKDDQFYPANNVWRIKPQQAETEALLTKRLANYVKHLALILKSAKERKQDVVSFEFSMGMIKIYNGGIGMHEYNIIPDNWKNTFYDETDAAKAYQQFATYLRSNSFKGASVGNWIDDDYTILLSIYADLNQVK